MSHAKLSRLDQIETKLWSSSCGEELLWILITCTDIVTNTFSSEGKQGGICSKLCIAVIPNRALLYLLVLKHVTGYCKASQPIPMPKDFGWFCCQILNSETFRVNKKAVLLAFVGEILHYPLRQTEYSLCLNIKRFNGQWLLLLCFKKESVKTQLKPVPHMYLHPHQLHRYQYTSIGHLNQCSVYPPKRVLLTKSSPWALALHDPYKTLLQLFLISTAREHSLLYIEFSLWHSCFQEA